MSDEPKKPTRYGVLIGLPEPQRSEAIAKMLAPRTLAPDTNVSIKETSHRLRRCSSKFKDESGKQCDLAEGHEGMHEHHESYAWRA